MANASKKVPLSLQCKWNGCAVCEAQTTFESVDELARHVHTAHVDPFETQDVVVCLWEGCKVYNVPSSSYQWLKGHVQRAHTKDRPFKCIMNGCNMSFNTMDAQMRHVQRHLEPSASPGASPQGRGQGRGAGGGRNGKAPQSKRGLPSHYAPIILRYPESLPVPKKPYLELLPSDSSVDSGEEYGKKPLTRKKSFSLKVRIPRRTVSISFPLQGPTPFNGAHIHTDVLDHKTMSVVRQTCNHLTREAMDSDDLSITVKAAVLGKRRRPNSLEDDLLVRWTPLLTPDSWVPRSEFSSHKTIPLSQLSDASLSLLASSCFSCSKTRNRRSKRKP